MLKKVIAILIILGGINLFIFYNLNYILNNPFIPYVVKIVPDDIKTGIKNKIYNLSLVQIKIKNMEERIATDRQKFISSSNSIYFENPSIKLIETNFNKYNIEIYPILFPDYYGLNDKPVAYLEEINNHIVIISGDGTLFRFNKNNLQTKKIILKRIHTNLKTIIKDEKFYSPGYIGIRDLFIHDKSILISYLKEKSEGCYNTSILKADLNFKNLLFEEFFTYDECRSNKDGSWNPAASGGRITSFIDGKILFSIGDYISRAPAQDMNSMFGKIFSIDLETKEYNLISIGHRNPQGLYYDSNKNIIINTEHGPKGGDEMNVNLNPNNEKIENFGWPISSYGEHYNGELIEEAPLYKSHKDYGFIEPAKYYTPSISTSEIIKIPHSFDKNFTNDFFLASMGYDLEEGDLSIHHYRFNENYNDIIFEDIIPIGERIRDLLAIEESKKILMVLENTPALGIIKINN